MGSTTRQIVVLVGGSVLLAVCEVPVTAVRAPSALLLSTLLGFAAWRSSARWWRSTPSGSLGLALISIPAALICTGFFLSITRIGIRPNSVAPCIFVIFAILTLLARADDAPQVPPPMRTSPRATGVLLVCATAVLAGATVASVLSYRAWEDDFHFTTLAAHTDGRGRVVVDMVNHEGSDQTYRLVVSAPGVAPALDKTLNVTDGHAKNVTSTVPPNSVVEISLYRAASNLLIRVVTVDPSAFIDGH